jgi:hypothetical protein
MKLKGLFLSVYITLTLLMFITFKTSILVWISFSVSSLILLLITIYHLYYEKKYSPFLSAYIVFSFLFFLAAPISQINSLYGIEDPKFVNFFPFKEGFIYYANLLICVFNIIFIFSYLYFKKRLKNYIPEAIINENQKHLPFTILIILGLSFLVFFGSIQFVQDEFSRPSWVKSPNSVATLLVWKKFLFMIPFAGIILCFQYFKKDNKIKGNLINIILFLSLFTLLIIWFKNPFTEKRNALGPIYLSIIFLAIPKLFNTNLKTLSFLFFVMIIVFPLSAIITHSDATFIEIYYNPIILIQQMKGGGVSDAFNTLNYDAFGNIMATIDYVQKFGFSYGYQLLGGVLFFIPRAFWTTKPYSSGQVIGEHLINDFGFGFSNLSNPLVSESFINFGWIGVLVFPVILAYVFIQMIKWLQSKNYLKKTMAFYFAMHLIFLLRGDFTNGFSYYISPLIIVLFLPKFIEILTKEYLIYAKRKKIN